MGRVFGTHHQTFLATVSRRYRRSIYDFIICIFFPYCEGYEITKDATCSRHGEVTTACTVLTLNLTGTDRISGTECKVVTVLDEVTCEENV